MEAKPARPSITIWSPSSRTVKPARRVSTSPVGIDPAPQMSALFRPISLRTTLPWANGGKKARKSAIRRCMLRATAVEPPPWAISSMTRSQPSGLTPRPPNSGAMAMAGTPSAFRSATFSAANRDSLSSAAARAANVPRARVRNLTNKLLFPVFDVALHMQGVRERRGWLRFGRREELEVVARSLPGETLALRRAGHGCHTSG